MSKKPARLWPVFRVPVGIGVLTAAGLFAALLGDGAWDALSWVGLGVPAVLAVWGLFGRAGAGR